MNPFFKDCLTMLKTVALAPFSNNLPGDVWDSVKNIVAAIVIVALSVVFLLIAPLSIPLLTWLKRASDAAYEAKLTEARQRLAALIHQNGPGAQ